MPTIPHQRILAGLHAGDLLWELPTQAYFTQYDDRTGRQIRVHRYVLERMQELGWIRRISQDPSARKLDFWEITAAGRKLLESSRFQRKGPARETPKLPLVAERK